MKQNNVFIKGNKVSLRTLVNNDLDNYHSKLKDTDKEVFTLTGTITSFTFEDVQKYFNNILNDPTRYDFLILNNNGDIIGESVLKDIDCLDKSGYLEVIIANLSNCGIGLGREAMGLTLDHAFNSLNIEKVETKIFSFNEMAYKAYTKAGFKEYDRITNYEKINGKYCDLVLMEITKDKYLNLTK